MGIPAITKTEVYTLRLDVCRLPETLGNHMRLIPEGSEVVKADVIGGYLTMTFERKVVP